MKVKRHVAESVLSEMGIGISGLSSTSGMVFAQPSQFKKATPGSGEHTTATRDGKKKKGKKENPAQSGTAQIRIAGEKRREQV